jgi:hypothetical protein
MAYANVFRIDFRAVGDILAMAPAVDLHGSLLLRNDLYKSTSDVKPTAKSPQTANRESCITVIRGRIDAIDAASDRSGMLFSRDSVGRMNDLESRATILQSIDNLGCVHYQLGSFTDSKPNSRQDQIRTEC